MNDKTVVYETLDANEAVAKIAYKLSEVIAIYPITPSSPMGEFADAWAAESKPNIWGTVPTVIEMQSEGGAAGALHGALQSGSIATTFTASQGLMLMIPNMYKIAGELTPCVIHVAARSLAAQALSIFGDHSDVMATRQTGFALLSSDSVQSAHDFALISIVSTFRARVPFLHFFDGFRTSHELTKVTQISDEVIQELLPTDAIIEFKRRRLTPDTPVIRGTAQNPDVYFQGRETVNQFYTNCPDTVQNVMDEFARLTQRQYKLFEYHGHPEAERIIILMGSGCETVHETVDYLMTLGEKVGVLKVRLYRPFSLKHFQEALPKTVKFISVLDRTKEPGANGEPLYLDVSQALYEAFQNGLISSLPKVLGGRYGLSSKEFTPAMVKAVFENMKKETPKNHFTVGIYDDVTHTSLEFDPEFTIEKEHVFRATFYGLGADGTVSANKNSIKIIGETTNFYAQGYFVYDSKKSGSTTVSHLRFSPEPIRSTYLITHPKFVACHQTIFLKKFDMLSGIQEGGIFLLNTKHPKEEVWETLPGVVQKTILEKKLKFYIIDAYSVAQSSGMKNQINVVMQVCFFAVSEVLPKEEALQKIKEYIQKTYGKKGAEIVRMNLNAVDNTLDHLYEVDCSNYRVTNPVEPIEFHTTQEAPDYVKTVVSRILSGKGDLIPVSAMPIDGTFPTGTAKFEKRNIALDVPVWDKNVCIQCGKCVYVCPHSVIRMNLFTEEELKKAPDGFEYIDSKVPEFKEKNLKFTLQVSTEDCTGCAVCVDVCPAKNKSEVRKKAINMTPIEKLSPNVKEHWEFFIQHPPIERNLLKITSIRQQQFQEPLFEFSGACAGCGETPYLKLVSQLFGDRLLIANATGCSSIYGGNLPTTPWTKNREGRGPAWSNSLFEDNAEFGMGFRVSLDQQIKFISELLLELKSQINENELVEQILTCAQRDEAEIYEQRERVTKLKEKLKALLQNSQNGNYTKLKLLLEQADVLVKKSVWIVGGDGWAYDIGFGGLDHVLASGRNVNLLVLDTEVYSNTGGQMSKSTPRAAVAKFASGGKPARKKDLGLIAMSYGNVYVASVAMGAKDEHTLKAFLEAESYDGPSLIIAYSHCIAHGIDTSKGMQHQKAAVESGQWLLYRYDPRRKERGENPLQFDSPHPKIPVAKYLEMENRFKMLVASKPEQAKKLFKQAQEDANERFKFYEFLSGTNKEEKNEP
ncbi:MAG: pyruvate:ferredoxin (flavodoxin) oxidoreductase [Leptospiraceae bacterium]|nr:pyruvate:ferredoxin (flavodoxin) oxidoreductase [Leptospiraceae bacterium]